MGQVELSSDGHIAICLLPFYAMHAGRSSGRKKVWQPAPEDFGFGRAKRTVRFAQAKLLMLGDVRTAEARCTARGRRMHAARVRSCNCNWHALLNARVRVRARRHELDGELLQCFVDFWVA
jgi:hypothetical protein